MFKKGLGLLLRRISENIEGRYLQHHEVTSLAHAALQILDDVDGISLYREEIKVLLKMLTTRAPHHSRCSIANLALYYLILCRDEETKKEQGQEHF